MRIAVDVGGTNIVAGLIDDNFNILSKKSVPSKSFRTPDEIIFDIFQVSKTVLEENKLTFDDIPFWGIGMPSCINPATKNLVHANCFGWKNFPIFSYLEKYTNKPIYIENDANCAAYGEVLAGSGKSYSNAIMLTLGTGVGGGIIIDKKIYSGSNKMGAELGHTKLIHNGNLCTCGKKGCLETYASATALVNLGNQVLQTKHSKIIDDLCKNQIKNLDGKIIFQAAAQNDMTANIILEKYCDYLASGISSFISIFRPEVVILGGGISEAKNQLLDILEPKVFEQTFAAEEIGIPKIICGSLGNDAGLIGAAFLAETNSISNK